METVKSSTIGQACAHHQIFVATSDSCQDKNGSGGKRKDALRELPSAGVTFLVVDNSVIIH